MDVELLLQCHDYDAKPEPSALDIAYEKIEAQQLLIEELQNRLEEVTLKQSFQHRTMTLDSIPDLPATDIYRHFGGRLNLPPVELCVLVHSHPLPAQQKLLSRQLIHLVKRADVFH